jgi:CBS domain containing-hemolysin-like protein
VTAALLGLSVALLLANAFFVAVEFALVASRRSTLEPMAAAGDRRARRSLAAVRDLNVQLAGSQLGITMASLGLGAVAEPALAHVVESLVEQFGEVPEGVLHGIGFVVALSIVVFLHLVIGEMVPKSIAIGAPEAVLTRLAGLNRAYMLVFGPIIRALNALANVGMRLVRVEQVDDRQSIHTAGELAGLLAEAREGGFLEERAHALLSGALELGGRRLLEITVPREQVVSVLQDGTVAAAEALVVEHGTSRLVVLDRAERPIGFIHAKDLLAVPDDARQRPLPLARIRRVLVLRSDERIDEVLVAMRRARTHVAAVIDEGGRWCGLVTLEDVLESVVGDIIDESDAPSIGISSSRDRNTSDRTS